jgi:hypothetical protein
MDWSTIQAALNDGRAITWNETEPATTRQATFTVEVSKWSQVVGRAIVKATLTRVKPPATDAAEPARYLGTETFDLADGQTGYERARVAALADAYRTREASEK